MTWELGSSSSRLAKRPSNPDLRPSPRGGPSWGVEVTRRRPQGASIRRRARMAGVCWIRDLQEPGVLSRRPSSQVVRAEPVRSCRQAISWRKRWSSLMSPLHLPCRRARQIQGLQSLTPALTVSSESPVWRFRAVTPTHIGSCCGGRRSQLGAVAAATSGSPASSCPACT